MRYVVAVLLLAFGSVSSVGEAATAGRCTSRSATHKGCVDVLTQGAHLSATLQWLGSDAIFFQSNGDLERATLSTRTITTLDGPGAALWFDAISPDGSTLVYTTFQPDASVRTVPTSGGTPFDVTSYPAGTAQPQGAIWRADGQRLAYVNDYVGGEVDWVPATGGQPTIVMAAGDYLRQLLTYGSNGTMVVEETDRSGQNGVLVSVSESGAQTVLATDAYRARASPDGSTIVYATSAGDLYAIAASGGAPLPLGVNIALVFATAFSPDGSLVAVAGYDEDGTTVLTSIAHTDGSGAVNVGFAPTSFDWSPDGSRLALCGRDPTTGTGSLALVDADGTHLKPLAKVICEAPAFAPDGSKIAFVDVIDAGIPGPGSSELALVSLR